MSLTRSCAGQDGISRRAGEDHRGRRGLHPGWLAVIHRHLGTLAGVYKTPALHADVTCVFTNTNPVRPIAATAGPRPLM